MRRICHQLLVATITVSLTFQLFDFCCGFDDNDYFSSFGLKDLSILIFSFSMILLSIAIFLAIENNAANRRTMDNINLFDNKIILLSDDYARKFLRYLSALRITLKSLSRAPRDDHITGYMAHIIWAILYGPYISQPHVHGF